jgi:hypothetical protein
MNRTPSTAFQLPSTAVALTRVGFGSWATQMIVARELAGATLQWSRLTSGRASWRPASATSELLP